jgi:flagellar biosynthesis protein FlhG
MIVDNRSALFGSVLHRKGRIIAVASGKGGVGKTWFAANLAYALARQGRRCLLFDGDLGLANVDIQLGLMPEHDISTVLRGTVTMDQAVVAHAGGFDILAGRSGSGQVALSDPLVHGRIGRILQRAAEIYGVVIIDLGAGLDPFVRKVAAAADVALVVATDEPTSLTDAYAVLKLHRQDRAQGVAAPHLVINFAKSKAQGEVTFQTLARASQNFLGETPGLLGVIRRDERVRSAIRRQTLLPLLYPEADAVRDTRDAAGQLTLLLEAGI